MMEFEEIGRCLVPRSTIQATECIGHGPARVDQPRDLPTQIQSKSGTRVEKCKRAKSIANAVQLDYLP